MSGTPHNGTRRYRVGIAAFSLVEVVLAMGIIAFALIVLLGLLPVGLKSNNDSLGESQAVNMVQALIADRQATAYSTNSAIYNLPALTNTTLVTNQLFLTEAGAPTTQPAQERYRVSYAIYPAKTIYAGATNYPAAGPPLPYLINFKVSWPAAQTNQTSDVETVATFMLP